MSGEGIGLWLSASMALHLSLAGAWLGLKPSEPEQPVQLAAKTISLGLQAAAAGSQAKPRTRASKTVEPKPLPPKPKPKPKPRPKLKPLPQAKAVSAAKVSAAPIKTDERRGKQGVDGSRANSKRSETGQGKKSGAQSLVASYDSQVLRHLNKFKRYPKKLRPRRLEGQVQVSFSIDRSGKLLGWEILQREGHRLFERAARKQLRRAAPYPAAPEQARWQRRQYKMDIYFSVVEAR